MKNNSKLNTVLLVVLILLVCFGIWKMSDKKENVTFNQPILQDKEILSSQANIKLNMNNEYVKSYKTLFSKEFSQPVNFSEHFRIVPVGCGSACMYLYTIDKNTGEVYKLSNESFQEYSIQGNVILVTLQTGVKISMGFSEATYGNRYPAGWVIWKEMINGQEVEKIGPSVSTKDYLIKLPSPLRVSLGLSNCVGDSETATCTVGNNPEIKKVWEELNKYQ